jgi:hypothetical protein
MPEGADAYFEDHKDSKDLGRLALRTASVVMQYGNGILRRRLESDPAEAGHHGGKIIAAVEGVLELGVPARACFLLPDSALDVAEHHETALNAG